MRYSYIKDIIYVLLEDEDLEILRNEGACHIKGKYFVMNQMPGYSTEHIRQAMDLTTELILIILPGQLASLEGYNLLSYSETLRLSTVKAFDQYVSQGNFKVVNITSPAPNTLQ